MESIYLGRVAFAAALNAQRLVVRDSIFGFEPSSSVITLGRRAQLSADVVDPGSHEILLVDRGGQATLHNPGQLVIFPVGQIPAGVRAWVRAIADATIKVAADYGTPLVWREDAPGLYDGEGAKMGAIGIRVFDHRSSHGLALNVRNVLADFDSIRACGQSSAKVSRLGVMAPLEEIFTKWVAHFHAEVDKSRGFERC